MTKIVNIRHALDKRHVRSCVRIDRTTRWGNPFVIGRDGTRSEVIAKYRVWLWRQIESGKIKIDDLAPLHGQTLACWCAPRACHGDVLADAAAWAVSQTYNKPAA